MSANVGQEYGRAELARWLEWQHWPFTIAGKGATDAPE